MAASGARRSLEPPSPGGKNNGFGIFLDLVLFLWICFFVHGCGFVRGFGFWVLGITVLVLFFPWFWV